MRAAAAALLIVFAAGEAAAQDDVVSFIACPVYRDTDAGRKSGCWLADERQSGVRYDVSPSPTKPDWNYEILVEGKVSQVQDDACGGVVLDPVRVSVLEQACPRHLLPAEDYPGREFVVPPRNVRPLAEARPPLEGPFEDTSFNIYFDFNRSFVVYQYSDYLLDKAIFWLKNAEPRRIVVTGYAATEPREVSGREIAEYPDIAQTRAETIAEALRRAGIPADRIEVRWLTDAQTVDDPEADGLAEASRRRVEIRGAL